jgi:5-oxoprolinase (ATP-hydrolysing) subunit C
MTVPALETLTVVAPGFHTLIVDQGRPRTRSLGVPVGGAADRRALALGNALVGNEADAAALEINLTGPTLRGSGQIAAVIYGSPVSWQTDKRHISSDSTFTLEAGETISIGPVRDGIRAYFCVRGGFQTPLILGSRSALTPLAASDRLLCQAGTIRPRFFRHRFRGDDSPDVLRTVAGAQADWFPRDLLYQQLFQIKPESNRMGLRLKCPKLFLTGHEMISEPVCPGSVQVTRDGQCIILGVDGQTIGGYPKIAQVIAADLDKLARLRPGAFVRFQRVEPGEAETIYREQQEELHEWLIRLRTVAGSD